MKPCSYQKKHTPYKKLPKNWSIIVRIKNVVIKKLNQALAEIDNTEYNEVFNSLAEKKANSITETNKYKKKQKLIDYLLYRGWETHLVYEKAREFFG